MSIKKLISIVIPAYNEEECVDLLYAGLSNVIDKINNYDFEVIIVENGSEDETYNKLLRLHNKDSRFKILKLTRNFTADGGISAGLEHINGDAAIIMYADLQEPPNIIAEFIKKWEEGYLHVYGIVKQRADISWLRKLNSHLYYFLIHKLTKGLIPKNVGDLRLVDKVIYKAIAAMPETQRILRGMFPWTGGKSIGIEYSREKRVAGTSKAFTFYTLNFAFNSILSFSYFPISLMLLLGFLVSLMSFVSLFVLSVKFILFGVPFDGFGTIVCLIFLLFGLLFLMLGIMGKYITMLYTEVKARPVFIVSKKVGFDNE